MQTMIAPSLEAVLVTAAEIRQSLATSQRLIASQHLEEAAALLWSAFETAVRLSLTDLGKTEDPIWISDTPLGLSAQAVAYGVIDPQDRDVLLRLLPVLDASHGGAKAVDVGGLQEVSRLTERTLDEMEQQ